MLSVESLIKQLNLKRHREGGYYSETYRSNVVLPGNSLPKEFDGPRNICTAIYFLIPSGDKSHFHKIKSDELWYYHGGASLSLYILENGKLRIHRLGSRIDEGENFQVVVPAGAWFGAMCNEQNSYTLCSCVVSPGFDFADFEMAKRHDLLIEFPQYQNQITMLSLE